ncbi:Zeta toxin [Methylomagnum ishizawai]|uniref:Zeta toxin n=1 Tax=Methylomagnum ishizawai TaxID=1760988 RepID=A0A1Y6D2F3_9GAMM|nr:zeta toxin family protein [Methylomagnum ishizawai]SMF96791.1 Zeta toxin [Methylomagnum ishizawai]
MINANIPYISGYPQLKKLRIALAVYQATKLLSKLQQESEGTVSHDQSKRVTYLTALFSRIHRDLFHDWKEQASAPHRPGSMTDADKRREFRATIERLVLDGEANRDTAFFDNNGFVIKTDNIAERLAAFYHKMRSVRPFAYGNRITLDFFMSALGNLPAFKAVYEQGIDFRRLEAADATALHDPGTGIEVITVAFEHALDPTRTKSLENMPNGYGRWPENKKFVTAIPFLSHRTPDGIDCLVTVNGGLVPLDSVKDRLSIPGKQIADYPLSLSENIIGYLPGTEHLRVAGKTEIDGIQVGENGVAPLFCLDINMLTGLRSPSHTELLEVLKECEGDHASVFSLANNKRLKNKLLAAASGDSRLERTIEIAYERLGKISRKLDACLDKIYEHKHPVANPKLFMCLGGAGSGKSAVEEIARAQCGDNFVTTSLDEFRKESDLYTVLTAANHHSDDYVFVEPFANRLRDMVANYAQEERFNLLYDGTGIPYKPRYSTIVEIFRAADFEVQMTAVDAFIVKPEGRETELTRSSVAGTVKQRFDRTGRALPWVITVDKHIRAPGSFLDALEHLALQKLSLFANDAGANEHYLVAESFDFSDYEVEELQDHQRTGSLAQHLKTLVRTRSDSVLHILAKGDPESIETLMARNPVFNENNVAYQVYSNKNGHRVLLVYNVRRMVDFVEKRQLNPNASGEQGLLHKPVAMAFHIDPSTAEPWKTRLQNCPPPEPPPATA